MTAGCSAPAYRPKLKAYGPLVEDPDGILDLPEGFTYKIISALGDKMTDVGQYLTARTAWAVLRSMVQRLHLCVTTN